MRHERTARKQEFFKLDPTYVDWFEREFQRRGLRSRSELYRIACMEYRDGTRSAQLTAEETQWIAIYRWYRGMAGDPETLQAINALATRAFVSADVARAVRDLAAKVALPDVRARLEVPRESQDPQPRRRLRPVSSKPPGSPTQR